MTRLLVSLKRGCRKVAATEKVYALFVHIRIKRAPDSLQSVHVIVKLLSILLYSKLLVILA